MSEARSIDPINSASTPLGERRIASGREAPMPPALQRDVIRQWRLWCPNPRNRVGRIQGFASGAPA